jgi:hypothetical protein
MLLYLHINLYKHTNYILYTPLCAFLFYLCVYVHIQGSSAFTVIHALLVPVFYGSSHFTIIAPAESSLSKIKRPHMLHIPVRLQLT